MTIGVLAGQRYEQIPALELAAVDHHRAKGRIGTLELAAAGQRQFGQRAVHAALRLASALRTMLRSLKARRSAPTS